MKRWNSLLRLLAGLRQHTDGATAVEYAAILAIISLAGMVALQGIGDQLRTTFNVTSSAWQDGRERSN